jgi:cysteate synthase
VLTTTQQVITRHYALTCPSCDFRAEDDGLLLECPRLHSPALLRTEYTVRKFAPRASEDGIFRYRDLLPVIRTSHQPGRTVVYRSRALAGLLGLRNLWIAFNGYWPERGAFLETATFKEFEAHTVLARLPVAPTVLTVSSSGNTGAAFAWACSRQQVPCLVIVPHAVIGRFRYPEPLHPCVTLAVIDDGDYPDAISFAAKISRSFPFQLEGGVKNVGRRDGLATVMLSAFEEMQRLPDFYIQAVGSGTGAIAAHEAASRLRGLAGQTTVPRLVLCQNEPFTPIYDAWQTRRRLPPGEPAEGFRAAIRQVLAGELTNLAPPYAVRGGVFDVLTESRGDVVTASNDSVRWAMRTFRELEGIDIEPAPGVAVAGLRTAVQRGLIGADSAVLLNITGGGRVRRAHESHSVEAEAQVHLGRQWLDSPATVERVTELCMRGLVGSLSGPEIPQDRKHAAVVRR